MSRVRPKKYLGQNFLKDKNIAKNIVDLLDSNASKNIIEIGPGMGALTQFLLNQKINLKLIEIDLECISYLKEKYPNIRFFGCDFSSKAIEICK